MAAKKKGPVVAKKTECDGIQFASGLEVYMYKALKNAGIESKYEEYTYVLQEPFEFKHRCYEKQSNGKGDFTNRGGKKIQPMKYTPDFVGENFIIECKGRANERFPLTWKMFKQYVSKNMPFGVILYKPQNQKDCDTVVDLILKNK